MSDTEQTPVDANALMSRNESIEKLTDRLADLEAETDLIREIKRDLQNDEIGVLEAQRELFKRSVFDQ